MPCGKQRLEPPRLPPQCAAQCQDVGAQVRTWETGNGGNRDEETRAVHRRMESSFGITWHMRLLLWEATLGKNMRMGNPAGGISVPLHLSY